ncbi:MAG: DsbA family protein [Myxococcota bacterium]
MAEAGRGGADEAEAPSVERLRVPVRGDRPSLGPEDALVTIVELSDFECPFCQRVQPTLARLRQDFGDDLRIVWRNNPLPFHRQALPAALAAMEAYEQGGDEAFWAMHERIFEGQRGLSDEALLDMGREVGLNVGALRKALRKGRHLDAVKEDQALAARLGIRGTPGFLINGRKLMGAQPHAAFEELVRDELERARRLVRRGMSRGDVYAHLMKTALEKAPEPPPPQRRRTPDPEAVYRVPVDDQPSRGPDDALVTIVEIGDFQCRFCDHVRATLERVRDEYGSQVRLVWMNNPLPFHREAMPAAKAVMEAHEQGGNAMFWTMHDLLFDHFRELSRERILELGERAGMDVDQLAAALDSDEHAEAIAAEQELAQGLGATGTPSFFINGRAVAGAQPFEAFRGVIDEELAKARELVRRGVPRRRLYARTVEKGATSPQYVDADGAPAPEPEVPSHYELDLPGGAPRLGPSDAAVEIHAFTDFQCPFCSRVQPTLARIMEEYAGKVALVFHHYPLPFHERARPAHRAAIEVHRQGGTDKFWQFHDLVFENQSQLEDADLLRYARRVGGIRTGLLRRAIADDRHDERIDADMEAVRQAGARIGTPSFFIDGKLLQGAQPYEAFKNAIEAALARE